VGLSPGGLSLYTAGSRSPPRIATIQEDVVYLHVTLCDPHLSA